MDVVTEDDPVSRLLVRMSRLLADFGRKNPHRAAGVTLADRLTPDCTLMDPSIFPHMDGVDIVRSLLMR